MVLAVQVNHSLEREIWEDEDKLFRYANYKDDIYLRKYQIIKRTPKGCWVKDLVCKSGKRFILNDARKRFAYPTREEALESFMHRKWSQIAIIKKQMQDAKDALSWVDELKKSIVDFNIRVTEHKLEQIDKLLCSQK